MADVTHDTVSVAQDPAARPSAAAQDDAHPPLRGADRGAVHARAHRRLLPSRDRRGGGQRRRDRAARAGRLRVRELPRPRHRARRRLGAARRHGRALRQGHRRRGRLRRLDAPARRRPPLPRRLGHRRRPAPDRRRAWRSRSTTRASRTPCSASSARARPTSARSTSRSTSPSIWHLPIVFQVINNRYGMGTSVEMASAEPEQWKRAAAYRMHGERVDGNDLAGGHARPPSASCARAREERAPALLETMTYRFRGHSVADAGKVYRARRGGRRRRKRTIRSTASWPSRTSTPAR